ncbi:FAD-dependent oxidoreductase [soil metagenome]
MAYVITQGCCNDAACISVCPVDCIRPKPGDPDFMSAEQLYIDPVSCIDCAACLWECPVSAIHDEYDLPASLNVFKEINAEYFELHPLEESTPASRPARMLSEQQPSLRVAVIGAGPSGCYAVAELNAIPGVEVSVFDRLPTPYGLVRAGVAPDHQNTKAVANQFREILEKPNVTCYFNVEIGNDITIGELLERHHAVIFSAGANDDRRLGIPGEELKGSHSAREFVAWYNGHPDFTQRAFDLSGERVVIIGNGNVALDVARVLAAPAEAFDPTDMSQHAVEALRTSGVREVVVSARRGALDAAFTTGEFLALAQVEQIDVVALSDEVRFEIDVGPTSRYGAKRRLALAVEASKVIPDENRRRIIFRFMLTPISINGTDAVESVTFRRTSDPAALDEILDTKLVLRAIGYRGTEFSGLPYDQATGIIPHIAGRVQAPGNGGDLAGVYCTGWAKRGATGIIGTNKVDAAETVTALFDDYSASKLRAPALLAENIGLFVASRQADVVGFAQWLKIDAEEVARGSGSVVAKARHKLHDVAEMVHVALR